MRNTTVVKLRGIAAHFYLVPEQIRLLKLGEEVGEVSEAYIGMLGANPRKGTTHNQRDVQDELADVVVTAYVALTAFTDSPMGVLERRIEEVYKRLDLPRVGPECDTHELPDCPICSASTDGDVSSPPSPKTHAPSDPPLHT